MVLLSGATNKWFRNVLQCKPTVISQTSSVSKSLEKWILFFCCRFCGVQFQQISTYTIPGMLALQFRHLRNNIVQNLNLIWDGHSWVFRVYVHRPTSNLSKLVKKSCHIVRGWCVIMLMNLLHPFWNHWLPLQCDWFSVVRFIRKSHHLLL